MIAYGGAYITMKFSETDITLEWKVKAKYNNLSYG